MGNELIKKNFKDIADSIRSKTGENGLITPEEMPSKIEGIETGITPTGTKNIISNGYHDVTNFATANVQVPADNIIPVSCDLDFISIKSKDTYTVSEDETYSTSGDAFTTYKPNMVGTNLEYPFNYYNVKEILKENRCSVYDANYEHSSNTVYIVPKLIIRNPQSVSGHASLLFTFVPWGNDYDKVDEFINDFRSNLSVIILDLAGRPIENTTYDISVVGDAS